MNANNQLHLIHRSYIEEELPTVGLAKDLMSKFKQKETDAKNMEIYKPSGAGNRVSTNSLIALTKNGTGTVTGTNTQWL